MHDVHSAMYPMVFRRGTCLNTLIGPASARRSGHGVNLKTSTDNHAQDPLVQPEKLFRLANWRMPYLNWFGWPIPTGRLRGIPRSAPKQHLIKPGAAGTSSQGVRAAPEGGSGHGRSEDAHHSCTGGLLVCFGDRWMRWGRNRKPGSPWVTGDFLRHRDVLACNGCRVCDIAVQRHGSGHGEL
jgi:hypothetical protein